MRKLKILLVVLLSLSMVLMTGCWNYSDIDEFAIVSGVAIDKGSGDQRYHLTFEIADISNGSESPVKPIVLESEGMSIYEAISNASLKSSKRLYFSHCSLFIVSQDIAKQGIIPVINCVNRDAVMRIKSNIAVSGKETAKEILLANPTSENLVAYEIDALLTRDDKVLSKTPQIWLYEASDMIDGKGISLIAPTITTIQQSSGEGESSGGGSSSGGSSGQDQEEESKKSGSDIWSVGKSKTAIPKLNGTTIFKHDKMIGQLSPDDSEYLMFIKNEVKGGPISVTKGIDGKIVTLNISESKTDITPEISGGKVKMKIKLSIKASLIDDQTKVSYNTEDKVKKLEELAEAELKDNTDQFIKKVQTQYNSDIFGFGRKVYQKDYKDWEKIGGDWENIFSSIEAEVDPEIDIVNTAVEKSKIRSGD